MIDILARICFLGKSFWQDWWNIADVCVGGLCMALMIDFLVYHGALGFSALYKLRRWACLDTLLEGAEAERAIIADEVLIAVRSAMALARGYVVLCTALR